MVPQVHTLNVKKGSDKGTLYPLIFFTEGLNKILSNDFELGYFDGLDPPILNGKKS
jgi:hypothetical protein